MPLELWKDSPSTTLAGNGGSITSGATTFNVASSTLFPAPLAGQRFRCLSGTEIMIVTAVSGLAWTATRGAEGTTAASHNDGDTVSLKVTANQLAGFRQVINPLNYGAKFDGTTDDTTAIQNALAACLAGDTLQFPPGTALIGTGITSGNIFNVSTNYIEIRGAGIGGTIFKGAASITLTNDLTIFNCTGWFQQIHDFSFVGGAGMSDGGNGYRTNVINVAQGSFDGRAWNIDCSNVWGGNTAGGAGVATYQPFAQVEYSTDFNGAVNAGTNVTITPDSMTGIYLGRTLRLNQGGAAQEDVQVLSVTATTFNATTAHNHADEDVIDLWSFGAQRWTFEDITVHDSSKASGLILNSRENKVKDCRVSNVGSNGNQHGFYLQAGDNVLENCHAEGISGGGYHLYDAVANSDGGANRFINCTSIDPGSFHMVAYDDGTPADGGNPELPSGAQLMRHVIIGPGMLFKRRRGLSATTNPLYGILGNSGNARLTITGNIFEDAAQSAIYNFGDGTVIESNQFLNLWPHGTAPHVVTAANACHFTGNSVFNTNPGGGTAFNSVALSGQGQAIGNRFEDVAVSADTISDNDFYLSDADGAANYVVSGSRIVGNRIHYTGNGGRVNPLWNINADPGAVVIRDNVLLWGSDGFGNGFQIGHTCPNVDFIDNDMAIGFAGAHASSNGAYFFQYSWPVDRKMGRLIYGKKAAEAVADRGYLFKFVAGAFTLTTISDTIFYGIGLCDSASGAADYWFTCGRPGTEANVQADGTWTAGNVGIISTTAAGKIHDTGSSTPPAYPASYVVFIDTHTGAGLARVLVCRTL